MIFKREYQMIFFSLTLNFSQKNNTNNMVNSSLKTFVFNSNSLLKTIFTFFTWFSIFRAGTISWGTTFHTISETFVFHFLAAFFANITFLALASSRFDACCKWTTPPFTNCCNENKILIKKKFKICIFYFWCTRYIETKTLYHQICRILYSNLIWNDLHRYSKTQLERTLL